MVPSCLVRLSLSRVQRRRVSARFGQPGLLRRSAGWARGARWALWALLLALPASAQAQGAGGGTSGPEARPREAGEPHATTAPREGVRPREAALPKEEKTERVKVEIPKQSRTYVERTPKPDRERARKLFHAGNKAFEQRQVDRALHLYQKAYAIWPHPRILFNQAVSLGFLGRPLESARTFHKVLEYGPEPITKLRYKQAVERYMELMGQLANLVVTCPEPGAKVYVNGEPVGVGPFQDKKVTLGPGTHMVTSSLRGKVPFQSQVRLSPGQLKRITVTLQNYTELVRYKQVSRYHWWVPTLVSTAAVVMASAGGAMVAVGRNRVQGLVDEVNAWPDKTQANPFPSAERDSAVGLQKGGFGLVGVGGAAAGTAALLWILWKKRVKYTVSPTAGGVKIRF